MAAVDQQQPGVLEMLSRPTGSVQGRCKAIVIIDGRNKSFLERKDSREPQLTQQDVARCVAMVKRASRRAQTLNYGIDSDRSRTFLPRL